MFSEFRKCGRTVIRIRSFESYFFQDRFRVDRDLDDVADDETSSVQRRVPAHAEVVAIDGRCCGEAGTGFWAFVHAVLPPRRLPLTQVAHTKRNSSSNSPDRQITANRGFVFADNVDPISFESDSRIIRDIEKIGASKVGVTVRFAGPEGGRLDRGFDGGFERICRIED